MKKLLVTVLVAFAPSLAAAQPTIVIDPGHGGTDPGGTGQGAQEKTIVLDVSNRFKDLLDADTADTAGGGRWVARLTRSNDTFVSLAARSQYSNSRARIASCRSTRTRSRTRPRTGPRLSRLPR